MAKITCDQIKLMELGSLCPIKDRDPNLIYAKFSTNEPTETVGFEELRDCLLKIDNSFDLLLVFVPGNNKFPPMYEVWVAATKEAFEKFNKASTKAREQKQYTEIARFINECKRTAAASAAIGILSNDQRVKRIRFDEYTRKIGRPSLDSLVSPYTTDISTEDFKNIIEIMYSVGYPIWVGEGPKSDDDTILDFKFTLQDNLLETIHFRATDYDMWKMTIHSTIKCHFLKIAEMALPYSIISICIKGYAAKQNNPRYIRCKNLEDYYVSALVTTRNNPDIPEWRETMRKVIMPLAETLATHNRLDYFIDDENACDKNIRKFIINIVKMFPDEMDICVESDRDCDDIYSFSIKHRFIKEMRVIFRPNTDNPYNPLWSVDIQSTALIALFALAVNKSIFDLIPSLSAENITATQKATETNEPDKKDTSYERCADLQQYAIQCWRIDTNPITKAIDKMLLARRMNRLIDLDIINVTLTERYTHDNDVRLFIAYIVKFYQGDMVSDLFKDSDGKCAFKYVHIEHPNMSVTFKPHASDMNKWEIDIRCPELIALFSMAINVSIDKMFPLREYWKERANQDFSGEMVNCYMKPIETTQYRDVPAPIVQRLVDKIHRMIETGSSITERIDLRRASNAIYGSQSFQALNCQANVIREYTAPCSNKAQLRIDGPMNLETTNATYNVSFTPSDCLFKDLVLEAMGRVPLKP